MGKKKIGVILTLFVAAALAILGIGYGLLKNIQTGSKNIADIEWYDEDKEEFTISTAKELYELARLSDFYDFEGQTIRLGADIVVNEGNAADWAEAAPAEKWYPITGFAGTFDGQGHTISGLYGHIVDNNMGLFSETTKKCVIRDFRIVNSYFHSIGSGALASVVGEGGGTLEKIYSEAIVVGTGESNGGIIGVVTTDAKASECWFAGSVTGGGRTNAGIAAWISGKGSMVMENCLNTGTIECTWADGGSRTAGLVGSVSDGDQSNTAELHTTSLMRRTLPGRDLLPKTARIRQWE